MVNVRTGCRGKLTGDIHEISGGTNFSRHVLCHPFTIPGTQNTVKCIARHKTSTTAFTVGPDPRDCLHATSHIDLAAVETDRLQAN
jgi:hypothetical protein